MKQFFTGVLPRAATRFLDHDGFALSGYIAFVGILSLFPFLVFLFAVFGFFGVTEAGTYLAAFIFENIPESVAETIETPIAGLFQDTYGNLLTFSVLGALWTAGIGLEGVRTALNRAYGPERRRAFWRRRGQGTFLILAFAGTLTLGLLFAPYALVLVEEALLLDEDVMLPWTAIRYGGGAIAFFGATCILYYWLPNHRPTWRGVLPGAALVLLGSLLFSRMFGVFLSYFDNYAAIYGSLAGVILSLLFFYYLGAIFIFGAEVNAEVEAMRKASAQAESPPQKHG
ncbi:MAG: YihY/virulence factor BrkB family protein [Rhodospirillaceae bacterium]|jgi:membrane protein|nr:YihY/virulence factor BrkB family protein [Rhodospirillaceae bacterium]MBT5664801.1 YihY/virulence factor BrkB family protein [Rhodospirillaceae bacterium]MBT5809670.1 YihY/virulence factor BrkB family protein [Rhodospirillaceae bacterium]